MLVCVCVIYQQKVRNKQERAHFAFMHLEDQHTGDQIYMFYYRHIWRRTNTTFFGAAFFSTPDDEKVSLGVFGLPLGSIACCLFPVVRHLKAVFVPSPRGWDVITPNLAQLVSHGVTCWQADPDLSIFYCIYNTETGQSCADCSLCAAAFSDCSCSFV